MEGNARGAEMRHLDLFSGIGGFALAARNVGWETVAFCEPDEWCQRVLAKHWPGVPIFPDIRKLCRFSGYPQAVQVLQRLRALPVLRRAVL
jgi:site-specific DNA-cytosine methylase